MPLYCVYLALKISEIAHIINIKHCIDLISAYFPRMSATMSVISLILFYFQQSHISINIGGPLTAMVAGVIPFQKIFQTTLGLLPIMFSMSSKNWSKPAKHSIS